MRYNPLFCEWVAADGTTITDKQMANMTQQELAYWQQRMQAQVQSGGSGMGLSNLLGGGGLLNYTSSGSAVTTSHIVYLNDATTGYTPPSPSPAPMAFEEFAWLRGRVQEICRLVA